MIFIDKHKLLVAFFQIFFCTFAGSMLAWEFGYPWQTGMIYGAAVGCGIFAMVCTDRSKPADRRSHI
jgi:hypothetical protein